jgi:hypothetical protein
MAPNPSWPLRPKGEEVSFYSFEADGSAAARLKRWGLTSKEDE